MHWVVEVLGWVAWSALAFVSISWVYGCRTYVAIKRGVSSITVTQTMLLLLLAVGFLVFPWPKLHVLWAAPLAYLAPYLLLPIPVVGHLLGLLSLLFGSTVCIGLRQGGSGPATGGAESDLEAGRNLARTAVDAVQPAVKYCVSQLQGGGLVTEDGARSLLSRQRELEDEFLCVAFHVIAHVALRQMGAPRRDHFMHGLVTEAILIREGLSTEDERKTSQLLDRYEVCKVEYSTYEIVRAEDARFAAEDTLFHEFAGNCALMFGLCGSGIAPRYRSAGVLQVIARTAWEYVKSMKLGDHLPN